MIEAAKHIQSSIDLILAKNEFEFHSDQCENQVFPGLCAQQVGGQYEILGIRF